MWATIQHQWPQYIIIAMGFFGQNLRTRKTHAKILKSVKTTNSVTMAVAARLLPEPTGVSRDAAAARKTDFSQ